MDLVKLAAAYHIKEAGTGQWLTNTWGSISDWFKKNPNALHALIGGGIGLGVGGLMGGRHPWRNALLFGLLGALGGGAYSPVSEWIKKNWFAKNVPAGTNAGPSIIDATYPQETGFGAHSATQVPALNKPTTPDWYNTVFGPPPSPPSIFGKPYYGAGLTDWEKRMFGM